MALSKLGKPSEKPVQEQPDLGLHHPANWILPRFDIWVRSGFLVFSNGKSYDEQSERLMRDYHTLLKRFNWWLEQMK